MSLRPIAGGPARPIRCPLPGDASPRDRAREAFAAQVERIGPGYRNVADSIRSGWENIWIKAGIDALAGMIRSGGDD